MAKIIEVTAENKIDTRLFDSLLKEYRSAYEQKQKLHDLVIKSILSGAKKHHLEFGELEEVDDEGLFQFLQPNPYCCILKQRSPESSLRPVFLYQKTVRTRPFP